MLLLRKTTGYLGVRLTLRAGGKKYPGKAAENLPTVRENRSRIRLFLQKES